MTFDWGEQEYAPPVIGTDLARPNGGGAWTGLKIVEVESMTLPKQLRFPRSKRKRIRKKWRKRWTVEIPDPSYLISEKDGVVVCHPFAAAVLRRQMRAEETYWLDGPGGLPAREPRGLLS